jgi:nucleoid DNA-binding protein
LVDALLTTSEVSCDHIGVEKERLLDVVKALKAEIVSQLQLGEQVQLDGFGTFYLERMEAPMKTGTKPRIPGREMVRFKAHNPAWMTGEQPWIAHVLTNP